MMAYSKPGYVILILSFFAFSFPSFAQADTAKIQCLGSQTSGTREQPNVPLDKEYKF